MIYSFENAFPKAAIRRLNSPLMNSHIILGKPILVVRQRNSFHMWVIWYGVKFDVKTKQHVGNKCRSRSRSKAFRFTKVLFLEERMIFSVRTWNNFESLYVVSFVVYKGMRNLPANQNSICNKSIFVHLILGYRFGPILRFMRSYSFKLVNSVLLVWTEKHSDIDKDTDNFSKGVYLFLCSCTLTL